MQTSKFPQWVIESSQKVSGSTDYSKLAATPESAYMSLLPYQIAQVNQCFQKLGKRMKIRSVVDATTHIGADLINMAQIFPEARFVATEINEQALECLRHNIQVCDLTSRVTVVPGSCVNYLNSDDFKGADLVYFDPPWGSDYKKHAKMDLFLDGVAIEKIIRNTKAGCKILKVPYNFNMAAVADMKPQVTHIRSPRGSIVYSLLAFF